MEINLSWTDMKSFVSTRSAKLQYFQANNQYYLYASDWPMCVTAQISMDGSDAADQTDFETNYKSLSNVSPRPNVVQVLGQDSLTLCPFGTILSPSPVTTPGIPVSTVIDVRLPFAMTLKGAVLFTLTGTLGDWVSASIVDKDNITGQGGTPSNPTILGSYLSSWYIAPNVWNTVEDASISQPLPQGVYLRFTYNVVGTVTPVAIVNFFSYVGTP